MAKQTVTTHSRTRSILAGRLLCSTALALISTFAHANPKDGQVAAGSATITQPTSGTLNVTQQTDKAIINWQSFSIGQGETTNFHQPNAHAITLNRVTGVDPSKILGTLTANGQVWLINPNGIAFGKSARVDVAGLLATTLDIRDRDFMAGNYKFDSLKNPGAMVTNAGQITVRDAGLAALVAPGVENSGIIQADLGQIQLSSAAAFTVDFYGDGLFNITLDKQATQAIARQDGTKPDAAVSNSGTLIANGGKVLLTANAAKSVVDNAVDMSGYVQATSANVAQNGDIVLDGGSEGTVQVAGAIDASGKGAGQTGGTVEVTGNDVNIAASAKIDVSGSAGGGTALVGGDLHGAGMLHDANTVTVAPGTKISADATETGNGGKVVIWSNQQTQFGGTISAKGGNAGGNGGTAEVSSHGLLGFDGTVDLRAPNGQVGTLLLDPQNVTIAATGSAPTLPSSGPTTLTASQDDSVLAVSTLQNALALADVTVSTGSSGSQAGDITVATNISWSNGNSLTLSAYRNITVNDGVTIANTGAGNLSLRADSAGTGTGAVAFNGAGLTDWSGSTGAVSIFYNPSDNPADSQINTTSYTSPVDFSSAVRGQLTAYMLVNTIYDLQNIRNNTSANYALGKDIDAAETVNWNGGAGFSPILEFNGIIDGQGHSIDGLVIHLSSSPGSPTGLFAEITVNGQVADFSLLDVNIAGSAAGSVVSMNEGQISKVNVTGVIEGNDYGFTGGLVGENLGSISDSSSSATVSGTGGVGGLVGSTAEGTITRSFATGTVSGASEIGGLVGIVYSGEVVQSYATGSVSVTDTGALGHGFGGGGLVGQNDGQIIDSYATGQVSGDPNGDIGGLVGDNGGSITQSYAVGSIPTSGGHWIGGIAGFNGALGPAVPPGTITASYWDTQSTGQSMGGGGIGQTTSQLKSALPSGFDSSVWLLDPNVNDGYPSLKWQSVDANASTTPTVVNFGSPSLPPPSGQCSPSLPCIPPANGIGLTPAQSVGLGQILTQPIVIASLSGAGDALDVSSAISSQHYSTPVIVQQPNEKLIEDIVAAIGQRAPELKRFLSDEMIKTDVGSAIQLADPISEFSMQDWNDFITGYLQSEGYRRLINKSVAGNLSEGLADHIINDLGGELSAWIAKRNGASDSVAEFDKNLTGFVATGLIKGPLAESMSAAISIAVSGTQLTLEDVRNFNIAIEQANTLAHAADVRAQQLLSQGDHEQAAVMLELATGERAVIVKLREEHPIVGTISEIPGTVSDIFSAIF